MGLTWSIRSTINTLWCHWQLFFLTVHLWNTRTPLPAVSRIKLRYRRPHWARCFIIGEVPLWSDLSSMKMCAGAPIGLSDFSSLKSSQIFISEWWKTCRGPSTLHLLANPKPQVEHLSTPLCSNNTHWELPQGIPRMLFITSVVLTSFNLARLWCYMKGLGKFISAASKWSVSCL